MPSPVFVLQGRKTDPGVTNIRNVKSPHWRRWLGVESRCLVPFTSFSENELLPDGRRPLVWFALGEDCGSAWNRGSDAVPLMLGLMLRQSAGLQAGRVWHGHTSAV
jgi:hypothetical protein